MKKLSTKNTSSFTSKIKLASIALFLTLSLGLVLGIMQTPQDIRQRAQNTQGRAIPAPQCQATGGQPNTGLCVASTEGCLPGEEQDEGQLDCQTGETCCSLAAVPTECDAQSNAQTFCSTAANCTGLYNGQDLGQFDCEAGTICCKNSNFPTPVPTREPTEEPTATDDPTPTFGSISGPNGEESPPPQNTNPQDQPQQKPSQPANQNEGLIQIILLLIGLILGLFGR